MWSLFLIYILGFSSYPLVRRYRAGLGIWHNLGSWNFLFTNIAFTTSSVLGAFIWPYMLVNWFLKGKPPSPWKRVGMKNGVVLVRKVSAQNSADMEERENDETF